MKSTRDTTTAAQFARIVAEWAGPQHTITDARQSGAANAFAIRRRMKREANKKNR